MPKPGEGPYCDDYLKKWVVHFLLSTCLYYSLRVQIILLSQLVYYKANFRLPYIVVYFFLAFRLCVNQNCNYFQVCKVDAATQWEDMTTAHHTYSAPLKLVNIRTPLLEKMTAADLRFYTGVSPDIFKKLALCIQRTPLRQDRKSVV